MTYLLVQEISTSKDSLTICPSDSIWFGNTFIQQAGVYTDSLQNIQSCDSLHTLTLSHFAAYNTLIDTATLYQDSVLVLGKYYSQAGIYVDSFYTNHGCDSLFTIKISIDSSNISIANWLLEKSISVYPNPTEKYLYIETKDIINVVKITMVDLLGKIVLQQNHQNNQAIKLNLESLEPGAYLIKVHTQQGVYKKRIIISN